MNLKSIMNPIATDLLIKSKLEYSKYVNAGNIAVSLQPVLDKKILGYNWQKLVEATRVLPVPPVGIAFNNFTNIICSPYIGMIIINKPIV